jgi:hypothetical protein
MSKLSSVYLPDFRNLGVILRCFILVEGLAFVVVFSNSPVLGEALAGFSQGGALREPTLLAVMTVLSMLSPYLARLPYRAGVSSVLSRPCKIATTRMATGLAW